MASVVDINSGKLVEWSVTRLNFKDDWRKKINVIREKISFALSDMPESEEIRILIAGTYINYFHCQQILDILKTTESDSRNIFGQYSSKRYKDWQEIVKLYKQNGLYIVDCAQILNQCILFEIPNVKKSIEKNNKTEIESQRKSKLYHSSMQEAGNNLKSLSKKYDIALDENGVVSEESIRYQLKQTLENRTPLIKNLESNVLELRECYSIYKQFVKETLKNGSIQSKSVCSMLGYVLEKGNTMVYEWKYGKTPIISKKENTEYVIEEVNDDNDEIKWDCEIDSLNEDFSVIDFGIEIEKEGDGEAEIEIQDMNTKNEMRTIFEDLDARELVLDDLYEIDAFFWSCINAFSESRTSLLGSDLDFREKWSQLEVDPAKLFRDKLQTFIKEFTNKNLIHLLMLENSESYVQSITDKFNKERATRLKYSRLVNLMHTRAEEVIEENVALSLKLENLRSETIKLKEQLENAISEHFSGRKIRITGEIITI